MIVKGAGQCLLEVPALRRGDPADIVPQEIIIPCLGRIVRFGRNQDISSPGIDAAVTAASYGEGEQAATGE